MMTTQTIIDYCNQYRDDHILDVADKEVTVTWKLTKLTIDPLANECETYDLDLLTVNGLPAAWLKQEEYDNIKATLMTVPVSLGGDYTFKDDLNVSIHDYAAENDIDDLYEAIEGDN
jgi:hypothetical protein